MKFWRFFLGLLVLNSCEQEITVDLPPVDSQIVVEGTIFPNSPPFIILTRSDGYFNPVNAESLQNLFVHDAQATISVDGQLFPLTEFCTSDLSEDELALAAAALGVSMEDLASFNICVYTNPLLLGQENKVYYLNIQHEGKSLSAQTKIPGIIPLDTLYFNIVSSLPDDSLGFITGNLTDPDTAGNAYRWFAKRINRYPNWIGEASLRGVQKDSRFIAPFGSVSDDRFFNGLSFEFTYYRGQEPNSQKFDDSNEEAGFFKRGDTVAIQGTTIDLPSFKFLYSFESQVGSQGSPFSSPFNPETNVVGGLGAFIGYGAYYDTVICR
jgi:hypothetical protein